MKNENLNMNFNNFRKMFIAALVIVVKKKKTTQISINRMINCCIYIPKQKGINFWYNITTFINLEKTLCYVKSDRYKRVHTCWLHLWSSRKGQTNLWWQNSGHLGRWRKNWLGKSRRELSGMETSYVLFRAMITEA